MFQIFPFQTGIVYRDTTAWPTTLAMWDNAPLHLPADGKFNGGMNNSTHFGYVLSGSARIRCDSGEFTLKPGMYFSVPGRLEVSGDGQGIVASRLQQVGFFQIGGPIENTGRLRYIDGCSDSLLISPVVCGDACLNLLHIPKGVRQTRHTHPSLRCGVIVSGCGICKTRDTSTPLAAGTVFVIPAETEHSFETTNTDLKVIAWHPDSDTGPQHDDHPMVNRTIVNGTSAAAIPGIRT